MDEGEDADDYSDEVRREIAITLSNTPAGEWGELALCPGRYGCPFTTPAAAIQAGVERRFCFACRVIRLYRPA